MLLAVAIVACGAAPDGDEGSNVEHTGKTAELITSCDYLVGMNVCDPAYWDAEFQCGYDACIEMGEDEATATQCGWNYYDMGQSACSAVEFEHWLCSSGLADPTTCTTGSGSGTGGSSGSGTTGGGTLSCSSCSCTSESGSYSGTVCGYSTDELIQACYDSC